MLCTEKLFCKVIDDDTCQFNTFLMLNSMVQSTPFNPYDCISIYIHIQLEVPTCDELLTMRNNAKQ